MEGELRESMLATPADNLCRLEAIIASESAALQAAIDSGDGPVAQHEAQIKLLAQMGERINLLVGQYEIRGLIDAEFVNEVIDFLIASDYDSDQAGASHSQPAEVQHVSTAVQNLERRNSLLDPNQMPPA